MSKPNTIYAFYTLLKLFTVASFIFLNSNLYDLIAEFPLFDNYFYSNYEYLKFRFLINNLKLNNENNFFVLNAFYYYWNEQFSYLFLYAISSLILTGILFFAAFILSQKDSSFEKLSPYECGFEPFGSSQVVFNIQYYIIGILFMIFDLEVAYLFPWAVNLGCLPMFSFWLMIYFLILLTLGFIYEWKKGALDWT